jgi:glycosyltransferase involved in cell wall biosynthesis
MKLNDTEKKELIIGIDATNIRHGGGRTHLVEMLRTSYPLEEGIAKIIVWGSSETLALLDEKSWLKKVSPRLLNQGFFRRIFWQRFKLSAEARALGCDLLFIPGGSYSGNFQPVVAMSQNLLPFEWIELRRYGFSWLTLRLIFLRFYQGRTFRNANGTIFLTQYAKKTVKKSVGKFKGLVAVVPHGLSSRFIIPPRLQKDISSYSLNKPYHLLYVSTIDEYKHQWNVVEAVAKLRQMTGFPLKLKLVGSFYPPALQKLHASFKYFDPARDWVSHVENVSYENIHDIYKNSDAAIFASSCENMPNILLEYMASGLPIACSNKGPMQEILGEYGEYFDPIFPDSILRAIHNLIKSPLLREKLAEGLFERASLYSWLRCSRNTLDFFKKVIYFN